MIADMIEKEKEKEKLKKKNSSAGSQSTPSKNLHSCLKRKPEAQRTRNLSLDLL